MKKGVESIPILDEYHKKIMKRRSTYNGKVSATTTAATTAETTT